VPLGRPSWTLTLCGMSISSSGGVLPPEADEGPTSPRPAARFEGSLER
jgi:hypothetical protein